VRRVRGSATKTPVGIPKDEDERLQRLAEAKAQIQALTADEESDSDAA